MEDANVTEKFSILRIEDGDLYTTEGVQSGRLRQDRQVTRLVFNFIEVMLW